jgi:hypothetical protein
MRWAEDKRSYIPDGFRPISSKNELTVGEIFCYEPLNRKFYIVAETELHFTLLTFPELLDENRCCGKNIDLDNFFLYDPEHMESGPDETNYKILENLPPREKNE